MPIPATGCKRTVLEGVVFDMNGTLTVPVIDFGAMYRAMLGEQAHAAMRLASIDILHYIETWGPQEQWKVYETIAQYEKDGVDRLQCAMELCEFLDSKKIRRGLIMSNVKDGVNLFHQRFGMVLSSEFRPYEPDPAQLLHICACWGVSRNEVIMIGDSLSR